MNIRLLPVIIVISGALLIAKVYNIASNNPKLFSHLFISNLNAQTNTSQSSQPNTADNISNQADNKSQPTQEPGNIPAPDSQLLSDPHVSETRPKDTYCQYNFSTAELEVLQNLTKRRQELDSWSKTLSTKEAILKAADQKVSHKIEELKNLKEYLAKLLEVYNKKEDTKISSLVKIYENMKPQDAAKILGSLDMPILLEVIDRMKEAKAAPILAQMDPSLAAELTAKFAKQKSVPDLITP